MSKDIRKNNLNNEIFYPKFLEQSSQSIEEKTLNVSNYLSGDWGNLSEYWRNYTEIEEIYQDINEIFRDFEEIHQEIAL